MLNTSYRSILLVCFLLTSGFTGILQAQILDDTTKQLYGYHSIRYGTEDDVFMNGRLKRPVDSALVSIQRYGYIYKNNHFSQDLGNWATPLKSVTSNMPNQLGHQTGFEVFSPYEFHPDQIKYFDTKSPYAEIKYYQGSRGQQSIDASFTRNINAQWNVGFDLRRIVSKKIIGLVNKNDRQSENYAFDFFVSHHSKNERYFMLASFSHLYQLNAETGGIKPKAGESKEDLFDFQLERVWLSSARSLDRRYNYRVYQQYNVTKDDKLQVFYRFDYSRRTNRYDDNALDSNAVYYDSILNYKARLFDSTAINDRSDFNLFDNRAGLKGSSGSLFYAAYIKNRYVTMRQDSYENTPVQGSNTRTVQEWYLNGQLRNYFNEEKSSYVEGKAEIGIANNADRNYLGMFGLVQKGFKINASTWAVSPTLMQDRYISNLVRWDNNFNLQKTNNVFAQYSFTKKKIDVVPSLNVTNHKDDIYFTPNGAPAQYNKPITHLQASLGLRFNLWKIHIYNQFQYNAVKSDSSILRMPTIVNATQIFWESWLFKRATLLQTGFDVMYRTSYYGYGYNPLLQQYYSTSITNRSDFNYMDGYAVIDFFVNMQIRTARLFIKVSNLNQGMFQKGYFSTPYYTGLPRTIDFGISWRFFD